MNAKNSNVNNSKSLLPAKSVYVLPLLFILLFILAFASSLCPTVNAHACDCPNGDKYHSTLNGGIYFETSPFACSEQTMSMTFNDVPDKDKVKFARVYTGIWGGSPSKGGVFNISVNGNLSPTYTACDPCPQKTDCHPWQEERCDALNWTNNSNPPSITTECHEYITGCLVNFIAYNATPYIVTGTNTVTVKSGCSGNCTCWDGRIYRIALFVVYEDANMPEITYWINEGTRYLDNGSACCMSGVNFDNVSMYFNGSAYPGSVSDLKYWTSADPNGPRVNPEFNGNSIGACDYKKGTNFQRWDNILVSYLNPSSNLFYYYNPVASYERIDVAVLMLNSSGPANLTVTDISPGGLYADPSESGRYANVINATVVNYGKTAHFFNVTLYANDTKVDVKKVENLGEGESANVSFLWAPNATGSYVLNVTADVENIVKETDETNNSKTLDVTVTEAPPPEWQSPSSNVTQIPNSGVIELRAQGKAGTGLYNATLATNETGTWMNCTGYGSPMDMATHYNYSFTHTSDADWNNQTIEREPVYNGKPLLIVSSGNIKLAQLTAGTENLALDVPKGSKPASASTEKDATYVASKANDGDYNTLWKSQYPPVYPEWWCVNLSNVTGIAKLYLEFSSSPTYKCNYAIHTSNDNETWTKQIQRGWATGDTYTDLDWSCCYINVTFENCEYSPRITEFEAYGPGDYASNGTLTSSTIETSNPIVTVIPIWNSTEPAETNLSVNISVDNGATWRPATNGTKLTWDYNVHNTNLKYKVLFETTNLSRTPVLHDISLNYTTKDPIESEWLWSNFTWHNGSITCTTVGWKIYYEDMLGQTNCTAVKTFEVGGSWLQTTDADFNAGTKTNINVSDDAFRLNSSNTTVFDDGFEVDITTNWTVSANWARDDSVVHSGAYSAKLGNAVGNLDTKARDCSGAKAVYVDFWYYNHKAAAGEFDLQYWNGTTWNTIDDLTTESLDIWHNYQQKITDSQYFISDFKIRFAGSPGGGDSIWVDDMKIIKESFVTGNLISQTHDTGVGEPSYMDIIVGNSTSGGTAITTEIRAASDQGSLSSAAWHTDIASVPHEQWVQWRVNLTGDGTNTPTVYDVTINWMCGAGVANVVVTPHNVSFGNMLAGDNTTIYVSLTLNNSEGTAAATIEAVFKTNVSVVYGLNGTFGSNIIPGNYFKLGLGGNEKALTNTTTKRFISTLDAGATVDYNAILIVPAGQAADDYSGIVELSW